MDVYCINVAVKNVIFIRHAIKTRFMRACSSIQVRSTIRISITDSPEKFFKSSLDEHKLFCTLHAKILDP